MPTDIDRWLDFEGLDNVRDVGGLPLRDGGSTRSGVLLRSASLRHATADDVDKLVKVFGLKLVLDLRRPFEIERDGPTPVANAGVETVPLTFIGERGEAFPEAGEDLDPLVSIYRGYLADMPQNVVTAVRRLAAEDAGPSLVHCAAGKDRTGTLVALVLDAVGVERDAIIADYVLSGEKIEAMFRRWTSVSGDPMPSNLDAHKPRAGVIAAVLEHLDHEHGGAAGWLLANGLTQEELDRLRERLTA
ncbi:tyrosine-protein phosphatase [Actinomycetes bacterium KLBMP 9759]